MSNVSLKIAILGLKQRQVMIRADAVGDKHKWITTETGSHIKIDGDGNIVAGAGGKFNGKPLSAMGGTKKFTKYATNAERAETDKKQSNNAPIEGGAVGGQAKETELTSKQKAALNIGYSKEKPTQEDIDSLVGNGFLEKKGNKYIATEKAHELNAKENDRLSNPKSQKEAYSFHKQKLLTEVLQKSGKGEANKTEKFIQKAESKFGAADILEFRKNHVVIVQNKDGRAEVFAWNGDNDFYGDYFIPKDDTVMGKFLANKQPTHTPAPVAQAEATQPQQAASSPVLSNNLTKGENTSTLSSTSQVGANNGDSKMKTEQHLSKLLGNHLVELAQKKLDEFENLDRTGNYISFDDKEKIIPFMNSIIKAKGKLSEKQQKFASDVFSGDFAPNKAAMMASEEIPDKFVHESSERGLREGDFVTYQGNGKFAGKRVARTTKVNGKPLEKPTYTVIEQVKGEPELTASAKELQKNDEENKSRRAAREREIYADLLNGMGK